MTSPTPRQIAEGLDGLSFTGAASGIHSEFLYDRSSGEATIRQTQRVDPIIRAMTEMRNAFARNRSAGLTDSGLIYLAEVPVTVLNDIKSKYGVDYRNPDHIERLMGIIDRDYPKLKAVNMPLAPLAR